MTTFVQIDVQNLYYAAKDLNKRVNFASIMESLKESESHILSTSTYMIRSPLFSSEKFETFLQSLGFSLNIRNALVSSKRDGSLLFKGTSQGIQICIDCMDNIDRFDKWILMSGDGEFIDLCKKVKSRGKQVEVWAIPGKSFNRNFYPNVDTVKFLENKFLYVPSEKDKTIVETKRNLKDY